MPTTVTINNLYINGGAALIMSFDGGTLRIGGIQPTTIAEPRNARRARRQSGYQQDGSCPERAIQIDTDEVQPVQRRQRAPPVERSGHRGLSTMSPAPHSSRARLTAVKVSPAPDTPQIADSMALVLPSNTPQRSQQSSLASTGSDLDMHGPNPFDDAMEDDIYTPAKIRELDWEEEHRTTSTVTSTPHRSSHQPDIHHTPGRMGEALRIARALGRGTQVQATYQDEGGERSYTCVHQ